MGADAYALFLTNKKGISGDEYFRRVSARIYKILVDLRDLEIVKMPVVEQFFIGEHIAEVFKDHIKIAIVWNGLYHSRFFQSVATNRAALLRVFRSEKNAEIWLLRDKENEPMFYNSNH